MGIFTRTLQGRVCTALWPLVLAASAHATDPPRRPLGMAIGPLAASAPLPAPGSKTVALQAMVAAARSDAAQRTGQPESAVQVHSAQRVTWADGGLGCPRPGVHYTMALVPGYRIGLQVQARLLDYHASERGVLLLCPGGRSTPPLPDSRI
jgi:hypothetical protein